MWLTCFWLVEIGSNASWDDTQSNRKQDNIWPPKVIDKTLRVTKILAVRFISQLWMEYCDWFVRKPTIKGLKIINPNGFDFYFRLVGKNFSSSASKSKADIYKLASA